MRTPDSLTALVDHGIIDEVVRPLMSGKEAQVFLVLSGGEQRVAKIYKEAQNRSFQNRADYTEGRKVRNSRDQRAMGRGSRHGKAQNEAAWRSAEVDMIYRLRDAGVRVPNPHHFIDGVLIMELVVDAEGFPAPRLGDLVWEPADAAALFKQLLGEVVRMLSVGVVHGDLSDFNVLMSATGPVVIDFPQSVDAATNANARKLLMRDVENLNRFASKFDPAHSPLPYAEEMWELYKRNALTPETQLSGRFKSAHKAANTTAVLDLISDANKDERRRREVRGMSMRGTSADSAESAATAEPGVGARGPARERPPAAQQDPRRGPPGREPRGPAPQGRPARNEPGAAAPGRDARGPAQDPRARPEASDRNTRTVRDERDARPAVRNVDERDARPTARNFDAPDTRHAARNFDAPDTRPTARNFDAPDTRPTARNFDAPDTRRAARNVNGRDARPAGRDVDARDARPAGRDVDARDVRPAARNFDELPPGQARGETSPGHRREAREVAPDRELRWHADDRDPGAAVPSRDSRAVLPGPDERAASSRSFDRSRDDRPREARARDVRDAPAGRVPEGQPRVGQDASRRGDRRHGGSFGERVAYRGQRPDERAEPQTGERPARAQQRPQDQSATDSDFPKRR